MRSYKSFCLVGLLVAMVLLLSMASQPPPDKYAKAVAKVAAAYAREMQKLDAALAAYPTYFVDSSHATRLKKYGELIRQFKRVEWLFAYQHPALTYQTFLLTPRFQPRDFGPPLPDNFLFLGPFGIDPDSLMRKKSKGDSLFEKKFIERAAHNFRQVIRESGYKDKVKELTAPQIFEALRLQMIRLSTVTLANGDMVIEAAGLPSLQGTLEGWVDGLAPFVEGLSAEYAPLQGSIASKSRIGLSYFGKSRSFQQINRMQVLTDILIPLSKDLYAVQQALEIPSLSRFSALRETARHAYEKDAFNVSYFAPGEEARITDAKVELGKLLFFDPILSENNERACASCHKPELAFTDGNIKSLNFERGDLPRNAPTVINAAFQKQQFWDLRATSLEDQLDSVVNSKDEMHSSFEVVINRLNESPEYLQLFHKAFPECSREGIQRRHVKLAIAAYERKLVGLNSRFDQYVRGDKTKMNRSEINGFNIYMGKAKCGTCHYAPLFNGALPPYFDSTDHRSIGVPLKDTMPVYAVDPDLGVSKPTGNPFHHFSFKIPSIRNVALTAPYMHNGVYRTLEQVVNFYDHAGGIEFTKDMRPGMRGLPFFMILPEKLNLTDTEKKDLVAFLHTLNDTTSSKLIPHRLPRIAGKFASLDQRKIGGEY